VFLDAAEQVRRQRRSLLVTSHPGSSRDDLGTATSKIGRSSRASNGRRLAQCWTGSADMPDTTAQGVARRGGVSQGRQGVPGRTISADTRCGPRLASRRPPSLQAMAETASVAHNRRSRTRLAHQPSRVIDSCTEESVNRRSSEVRHECNGILAVDPATNEGAAVPTIGPLGITFTATISRVREQAVNRAHLLTQEPTEFR
jgi:hypothetical protein